MPRRRTDCPNLVKKIWSLYFWGLSPPVMRAQNSYENDFASHSSRAKRRATYA